MIKFILRVLILLLVFGLCWKAFNVVEIRWETKDKETVKSLENENSVYKYALSVIPDEQKNDVYLNVIVKETGIEEDYIINLVGSERAKEALEIKIAKEKEEEKNKDKEE